MKKPSQKNAKNKSRHKLSLWLLDFLASKKFYYITLGLFLIQSVWMAVIAAYPMAFDEGFHYGIIAIYAKQWSPILTAQPDNPGAYGELVHDPSYLYHYLMSFPYRLVMFLFHQYNIGVLTIRFIDIILFFVGLVIFRKLLIRFGISRALTHFVLFIVVLAPITPFLAGQVNYDNLIFCLTPIFIWFVMNIADSLRQQKIKAIDVVAVLCVGMLTSLVKYAFLPIFAAGIGYLIVIWITHNHRKTALKSIATSFGALRRSWQITSIVALVISSGLFLQRYGYNEIMYHQIDPDCAKVLSVNQCLQYGPWARNYNLSQNAKQTHANLAAPARNPLIYLRGWVHAMLFRLYFAINYDFTEYMPMSLPFTAAFIFGFTGFLLFIVFIKRIVRDYRFVWLFLVIIGAYCASLFTLNYYQYLEFGNVVAVNGRYLIPILPLIFTLIALGYRASLQSFAQSLTIKLWLLFIAGLMTLDGGGIITYIIHSDPSWYWRDDIFTGFNMWVKSVASKIVTSGINQPIDHLLNDLLR